MKFSLRYVPLHLLVFLIVGILLQHHYHPFQEIQSFIWMGVLMLLLSYLLRAYRYYYYIVFLLFVYIGALATYLRAPEYRKTFYQHHLKKGGYSLLQIDEVLKPTQYYDVYKARMYQHQNQNVSGNILLLVDKDTLFSPLRVDSRIFGYFSFEEIPGPLHRHQFSYKEYLAKDYIYQQSRTHYKQMVCIDSAVTSLRGLAAKTRLFVQQQLRKHGFQGDSYAVMNALLLGERNDISSELKDHYANAGAIHILAVSGLHIGIVLGIFSFLLRPLKRLVYGTFFYTLLLLVLLWMFAFLAGLSASVVRASTMFTAITVGVIYQQRPPVVFALILSMFVLLLVLPMYLFDVGFQLSYAAVFSIISWQPMFQKLWNPKTKLVRYVWQLMTVSIAAQLGVLPLSLFYFHQFPGLFMISNLVILPVLGLVLTFGFLLLILASFNILPNQFTVLYTALIDSLNSFVTFVGRQEQFLIQDIVFSFWEMLLMYAIIVFMFIACKFRNTGTFILGLLSIVFFQLLQGTLSNQMDSKEKMIIFHKSGTSIIANQKGRILHLYSNKSEEVLKMFSALQSYRVGERIQTTTYSKMPYVFEFDTDVFVVVDSAGIYPYDLKKRVGVLLQHNPPIHLERLIQTLKPSYIIADGSNYRSSALRWQETCAEFSVDFWYTGTKGAFEKVKTKE